MKCALRIAALAFIMATSVAVADESTLTALNLTDAASPTRYLETRRVYKMQGVDIVGKDIHNEPGKKVSACLVNTVDKSYEGKLCTAVVWTNYNTGWCWAKATDYRGTPTTPKAEADTLIILKDSTSALIWSETKDGFDMAGFDIDDKRGEDMGACFDVCNANNDCFAVTWTDYNGGTCWLKSRASEYVVKAGAKTAYVARWIL